MTSVAPPVAGAPLAGSKVTWVPPGRIASSVLMLLPGAALVYLSYHAGGFFPGPASFVAVVFALIAGGRLLFGFGGGLRSRLHATVTVAFVAYAAWVLMSGAWSRAPERAMTEANLVLVYGLGFALFADSVRSTRDLRWVIRGLAAGSFIVCLGAFLSRVAPKLWPLATSLDTNHLTSLDTDRLSYPLTYQNALGLAATVGALLCLGLTSDDQEPRVVKALSALAVPVMGATIMLTFSRGAMACGAVGLVAFLIFGRPRSLPIVALALVPSTAVALIASYEANLLAYSFADSLTLTRAGSASQGRLVAAIVAVCALTAAASRSLLPALDRRRARPLENRWTSRIRVRLRSLGLVRMLVVAAFAVGAAGLAWFGAFGHHHTPYANVAIRDRLTNPGSDGRSLLWRVAANEFASQPIRGTGAGTYAVVWAAHHPASNLQARPVFDAHSVYLENLGELGIVGFGLLICILLGSLLGIAKRISGSERTLYATAFAVALVWAVHAGVDWDWEFPAVTLPFFVLAGAVFGGPRTALRGRRRPLLGSAILAVAILPALINASERHLDASLAAFDRNDCTAASREASRSLAPLRFRRDPLEILGYCHAALGQPALAVAEMNSAIGADPQNWEPRYGLAVVLAATGGDPRPAARAAVVLNRDEMVTAAAARFLADAPVRWRADADTAPLPISGRYGPVLAGLRSKQPRPPGALSQPGPLADTSGSPTETSRHRL